MKLNDPFGRLESRNQIGYETMRDTMRDSGIITLEAARDVVVQSKKRAIKVMWVGTSVLVVLGLLVPKSWPVVVALVLFLVVWGVNSTRTGQRHIERYINEELGE